MYVCVCGNGSGIEWSEPLELMAPGDRSGLADVKITDPTFHEWAGACNITVEI